MTNQATSPPSYTLWFETLPSGDTARSEVSPGSGQAHVTLYWNQAFHSERRFATREEAETLMATLLAEGVKDEASAWHIRDVGLAFALGAFESRDDAAARVIMALGEGVPAYVVPFSRADGRLAYRVFAGGYADADEAAGSRGRRFVDDR